jgi:hypothetical protein
VVWWKVMDSHRRLLARAAVAGVTAAAAVFGSSLLAVVPAAHAAPPSDGQGYVDSTARCATPASMVVFGSTDSSRVAICRAADGDLEYRGVRVRDGARLIAAATEAADGAFTAVRDGVEYVVSSKSLDIRVGEKVIREELMLDFHRGGSASAEAATGTEDESQAETHSESPETSSAPLPPPLPAEVGAGGS